MALFSKTMLVVSNCQLPSDAEVAPTRWSGVRWLQSELGRRGHQRSQHQKEKKSLTQAEAQDPRCFGLLSLAVAGPDRPWDHD